MMDDFPLNLSTLYARAVRLFPDQEIVSMEPGGEVRRSTYSETDVRIRQLARILADRFGLGAGDRIGTFAPNNLRHHELYWATACTGLVCHTINIRLFPDQIEYIVNHAEDRVMFIEPDLVPLIEPIAHRFETVEAFVILGDRVVGSLPNTVAYDELFEGVEPIAGWELVDERSPMMFCYTSGTTGNPKGVAYTQRSTYLHTISHLAFLPIGPSDNVMPVVPMFHAAAWGYPFMATAQGAKITYPGADLSPAALVSLVERERVTFSAGVPTVWLGIQHHLDAHPEADVSSIRAFLCGGSAVPRAMIDWYWKNRGIRVVQGWGMTETNPVASTAILTPALETLPWERQLDFLETAGIPAPGLVMKIVDELGEELPHDGEAFGELLIRGPWIAAEYYKDERSPSSFVDGWLRTGDVCKITPEGYVRITDRAKDVIKSGGEWISSIDLENTIMAHSSVAEATVVGVPHPKWGERPVALVVPKPGRSTTEAELLEFLESRVAKWWLPDRIVFAEEVPKTGTGKFDKKVVRQLPAVTDLMEHWDAVEG
ncbi:MAG: long-chain fatty acid--CoA ligase [Acidimicrobiia bacterium]|nr:long-chain fatty acid--CoA ligase [Acidimicrobiia bacterium]MDH5294336.1 long-chain fatty acid--CoA ligase [Acidimicrobiia bacterium]